nr:adrenodoxin-NADP+ reductase [Halisarca dujardinii]
MLIANADFMRCPEVEVDILEKLPVPYGLIRYGVAPDHPEVKNVINQFHNLAVEGRCNFVGNIDVGTAVNVAFLKKHYHSVVLAYGAAKDRFLGIPGEDLDGVHSARQFVGWYNGLPEARNFVPDLSGESAVIVGQGNVAVDVARMLLSPEELLKSTDICSHALEALRCSRIRHVHLVGRRGPLQAAFTIKELRELTKLPGSQLHVDLSKFPDLEQSLESLSRPRKRLTDLIMKSARSEAAVDKEDRHCHIQFLRSPVEFLSDEQGKAVKGVKFEETRLEGDSSGVRAIGTGDYTTVECGIVFRSIGYQSVQVDPDIPFDNSEGIVINKLGRITDESGLVLKGLYCSGWLKRGPVGVILNTMEDAFETAESISQDIKNGLLSSEEPCSHSEMVAMLKDRGARPVSFSDWEKIDSKEQDKGKTSGKPREKIVSENEMLDIVTDS